MDRERVDGWLEWGILGLVLAVMVYAPVATAATRTQDFAVVQGMVALATALWLCRFWVNPRHRIQWPPVCWVVLGIGIYAVARYLTADVEYVARREVLRLLVCVWLFFIVLNNLHRQKQTDRLAVVLVTLGTLLGLYAIYQFITKNNHVLWYVRPEQYNGRGSATYICPNHFAGFLEMILPLPLAMVVMGRGSALRRILLGYAALAMLTALAMTASRGGYLAAGVALVAMAVFLARFRNYRRVALASLAAFLLGGTVFLIKSPEVLKRFKLMFTPGQLQDVSIRWRLTEAAFRMWLDHPWVGVGPAHYDVRFPQYRRTGAVQQRPVRAHNDYVNVLADWGLVGGVLGVAALWLLAAGVPSTWRYVCREDGGLVTKRSDRAAHVLGVSVGLIALAVHSLVDFNLHVPANALLAVALAASLASHRRFATRRYWVTPHTAHRLAVTLLGAASVAWLGSQALRQWREGHALTRFETAPTGRAQLAALQTAAAVEPKNAETAAKLGEFYRLGSWEGGANWRELAETGLQWCERAISLNPFDPTGYLRAGMCLDWLGRHDEAARRFEQATELDPQSYYVALMRGWHEIQVEHYEEAKRWLDRSLELKSWANFAAYNYLALVKQRLAEKNR